MKPLLLKYKRFPHHPVRSAFILNLYYLLTLILSFSSFVQQLHSEKRQLARFTSQITYKVNFPYSSLKKCHCVKWSNLGYLSGIYLYKQNFLLCTPNCFDRFLAFYENSQQHFIPPLEVLVYSRDPPSVTRCHGLIISKWVMTKKKRGTLKNFRRGELQ